jgi:hypothetical protein
MTDHAALHEILVSKAHHTLPENLNTSITDRMTTSQMVFGFAAQKATQTHHICLEELPLLLSPSEILTMGLGRGKETLEERHPQIDEMVLHAMTPMRISRFF